MSKSKSSTLKYLVVGDSGVGKTSLLVRYCDDTFQTEYLTTIGVDYGVKKITIGQKKVAVNFFDLSGSPDYEEIRNPFFEDSQVVLLTFDLENRQSFANLSRWENTMKSNGLDLKQAVVFLIGNKSDGKAK